MGRDVGHPSPTQDSLFADFNLWESQFSSPVGFTNHRQARERSTVGRAGLGIA